MDVSVIIVNWNTRELLRNCIQSVIANAGSVAYEIIVIDNASIDQESSKRLSDKEHELKMREKGLSSKEKELNKREAYIKLKERGD